LTKHFRDKTCLENELYLL